MAERSARWRAAYGAGTGHLLVLLPGFAIAGWVALRLAGEADRGRMLLWFLGAVVAHDLILFPGYAAADRVLQRLSVRPVLLNHVRVPALASALLFLVYLPGILGLGGATYQSATGRQQVPLLGHWLALSASFFLLSAVGYGLRRVRTGRPRPSPDDGTRQQGSGSRGGWADGGSDPPDQAGSGRPRRQ